ncbi:hypothetical protein CABS03_02369 [Colletotrichum abscissum]|uniref:CorA-like transporter domain-containing protein n=1 Tax=Colletotrichum abscissum TaxID=1671311 RepID=A0A9P9X723_9PEZI|nr:hypothetical protein CABS02_11220 [Colletotrichum abscissum]
MASALDFPTLYQDFDRNPAGYLATTTYGRAALSRLSEVREHICLPDGRKVTLPVRDILDDGKVEKLNVFNDDELSNLLGGIPETTATGGNASALIRTPQFRCRFVYLCAETALGPLEVHVRMLLRLLTFYQVMPQFLDFLSIYASPHGRDKELRFSGFKTETVLSNPISDTVIPELGRSGRRYQLCFNLKTVAQKSRVGWKIRQAAVHHQFDIGRGSQMWIVGDPHAVLKERTGEIFPEGHSFPTSFSTMQQSFASSLDIHLEFAQWAASEWRWHILFLEQGAEELTKPARVRERAHIEHLEPESLSDVQKWEEKASDAVMALESNANIMKLLQKFYRDLLKDENFPKGDRHVCLQRVKKFASQLEELICEANMQISRTKNLVKVVADRKTILIQHLQTQNAIISSKLTASMYEQADQSAMEAIAVRIVTIVTLIYLPATFSSTFFSTDVVKYQQGEIFSQIALDRFLQVTLPLMFMTFVPAGIWFWIEWRRRTKKSRQTKVNFLDLFSQETQKLLQ